MTSDTRLTSSRNASAKAALGDRGLSPRCTKRPARIAPAGPFDVTNWRKAQPVLLMAEELFPGSTIWERVAAIIGRGAWFVGSGR